MNFQKLRDKLSSVVAIPVTPFDSEGRLAEPAYRKVVRRLVDGGIEVITPNGNTGEFYALSAEEAQRAVDITIEEVAARPRCWSASATRYRTRSPQHGTPGTRAPRRS